MAWERQAHPLVDFTRRFFAVLEQEVFVPDAELRWLAAHVPQWARPVVELEAWQRSPDGLDVSTIQRLTQEVDGLLQTSRSSAEVVQVAALAGAALVRAIAKAGFESALAQTALQSGLDRVAGFGPAHDDAVKLSRFVLLEGVYDARLTELDHAVLLDKGERRGKAQALLDFVDKDLESARLERAGVLQKLANQDADRDRELLRMELAQEHRRLSWSTAVTAETDGARLDDPRRWTALADRYRKELGDEANAVGATSNGLERFVEVVEGSPKRGAELRDQIKTLLAEISDTRLKAVTERESRVEVVKAIVRGHLVVDETSNAIDLLKRVADETAGDLKSASDDFRRSFILRDSDDWLGLASLAGGEPFVREVHPLFRGMPLSTFAVRDDQVVIAPFLGRQRAALILARQGSVEVLEIARAHDIARLIRSLHDHAAKDIEAYKKSKQTDVRWRELLVRLVGMLGHDRLREAVRDKHVNVLAAGSAVHVPWSAVFAMADVGVRSVVASVVGAAALQRTVSGGAVLVNGFTTGEQWHTALAALAAACGATPSQSSEQTADHELLLVGAHGHRSPFGELTISLPSGRVRAADFAAGIPSARTAVCGICYAGGGFLSGAGDWESMPGLLLSRGAERVLANTWPAWDLPANRDAFAALIQRMRTESLRGAAEELFRWQTSQIGDHPRWWSGWTLWAGDDSGGRAQPNGSTS